MNEGIHLDLDTWIVPGQIRKFNNNNNNKRPLTPKSMPFLVYYLSTSSSPSKDCGAGITDLNAAAPAAPGQPPRIAVLHLQGMIVQGPVQQSPARQQKVGLGEGGGGAGAGGEGGAAPMGVGVEGGECASREYRVRL